MFPLQGFRAVREEAAGRSRRALRGLKSVGDGAKGEIGMGWELLRGVTRGTAWGGGVKPPGRGHGGGGEHAQGRQARGLSQSCSKVPSRGSAP